MITAIRKGNLFDSGAQTLVNTVNTVGVMGKGIALEFKRRFPEMFADYQRRCSAGQVRLGEPYIWRGLMEPWIINFPTKEHWRSPSKLADIEQGLAYLAQHVEEWGVTSLAVPPLGAGSGGLDWASVGPTLYRHLDQLPIPVLLYAPFDAPDEQATVQFLAVQQATVGDDDASKLPPGAMVIAEIVRRIDHDSYAWPIGRTRLQKLVYFATVAGVPTGLEFTDGSYGPFAEDLQGLLRPLINNGILSEARMGRMLAVRPGPTFADANARYRDSVQPHETAIRRVADLLARLDTQHTEIAASVHFAAGSLLQTLGRKPTEREVLAKVQHWKQRRQPSLPKADIVLAIDDLAALGWIDVTSSPDLPPKGEMVALA